MAFLETPRFPVKVSFRTGRTVRWRAKVYNRDSGADDVFQPWDDPLHRYDVQLGPRPNSEVEELNAFFMAVRGPANGFRFKDWMDYKSCDLDATVSDTDQTIGTGDGVETEFQLKKTYTKGALSYARDIKKPVSGTVVVAVDSVSQTEGVDFTVDTTTGLITFTSAPGSGTSPPGTPTITAGFEFDVPARFDANDLNMVGDTLNHSATIPIREIRV